MSDDYNAGEAERILAGMFRFGRIAAVDAANARVKVSTGGLTTDWLPWSTGRAGTTRHWSAPSVGEQVAVIAPHGDPTQGLVIPGVYQDDHAAPDDSIDKDVTVFADGTRFEYDAASNTYTQTVAGSGNWIFNCKVATINAETSATVNTTDATVQASGSVMLDTPQTTCTGALTVQGLLTYEAGMAGTGGAGASAVITGSIQVISGDVTADGVSLKGHTHPDTTSGGNTGPPN